MSICFRHRISKLTSASLSHFCGRCLRMRMRILIQTIKLPQRFFNLFHIYPDMDVRILLQRLEDPRRLRALLNSSVPQTRIHYRLKICLKNTIRTFLTNEIVAVWLKRNYMGKQESVIDRSTCHLTPVVFTPITT